MPFSVIFPSLAVAKFEEQKSTVWQRIHKITARINSEFIIFVYNFFVEMLPALVWSSWAQAILLSQPPKVLGLQA